MRDNGKETARQAYIRLLSEQTAATERETTDTREAILSAELIEEKYLEGSPRRDETGSVMGAGILGVTVKGRLFLQDLERLEKEDTLWARNNPTILLFFAWVIGWTTPLLAKYVEAKVWPIIELQTEAGSLDR